MSNRHPPQSPYGVTYGSTPQMATPVAASYPSMQQYHHQPQGYIPYWQGQGLSNGMMVAQSTNGYAHHTNIQGANQPPFSPGVIQTPYGGYANAAQLSTVPSQLQTNLPHSSYVVNSYTPQQPVNSHHPTSNEVVANVPPIPQHPPSAPVINVEATTVAHSPRPELEDGELSSGELSNSMDDLYTDAVAMHERPQPELARTYAFETEKTSARDSYDSIDSGANDTARPLDISMKPHTIEPPPKVTLSTRKQAQAMLRELHSYEIGFQDLANEGLEVELLRDLYAEMELPLLPSKQQKKQQSEAKDMNSVESSTMTQNSNVGYTQSPASNSLSTSSPNLVTKDAKTTELMETPERTNPISIVDTASPQNSGTTKESRVSSLGKNATKTVAAKPVDRKEYIARLMAAKSGKPLPSSTASPVSHDISSDTKMFAPDARKSPPHNAQTNTLSAGKDAVMPSTPSSQAREETSNMDAKRKAQTELALQKIEALKNQKKPSGQGQEVLPTPDEAQGVDRGPAAAKIFIATAPSSADTQPRIQMPVPTEHRQGSYFSPVSLKPAFSIPGLFTSSQDPSSQTDRKLPNVALAAKASQPPPSASITNITVENSEGPRKRHKAADFMHSPPATLQRLLSHGEDNGVVIDISDDDVDDDVEDQFSHQSFRADEFQSGNAPNIGLRPEDDEKQNVDKTSPPPGVLASRRSTRELANSIPSASNTPSKAQEPQELKTKVIAIETMNRKIFELEQRIKAKQTASRGQSPRALAASASIDGAANRQSSLPPPQRTDTATEEQLVQEKKNQQNKLATAEAEQDRMAKSEEQKAKLERHVQEKPLEPIALQSFHQGLDAQQPTVQEQQASTMAAEAPHQRIVLLEADLSALDAAMTRSQEMYEQAKLEIKRIEHDIQSKTDRRRVIQQELIDLSSIDQKTPELQPQPQPSMANSIDVQGQRETVIEPASVNGVPGVIKSLQAYPTAGSDSLDHESQDGRRESKGHTAAGTDTMVELEVVDAAHVNGTPSYEQADGVDQMSEEEFAEDNMDISGSDIDEGHVLESRQESTSKSEDDMDVADDGDTYEPPNYIGSIQPSTNGVIDDQQHGVDQRQQQPSSETMDTTLSGVEIEQSMTGATKNVGPLPSLDVGHGSDDGSSLPVRREEEDYEPPEPETFVKDSVPLPNIMAEVSSIEHQPEGNPHEGGQLTSKNSHNSGHFVPYESPLKHFASYRFHPEYRKQVSGGYRSLTYSHDIRPEIPICQYELAGGMCNDSSCTSQHFQKMALPDHLILGAMGKGEGSTPDEKEAYIKGLKSLILELRKRDIKDLDTIAEAISNYRLKFFDDASKIHTL